MDAINLVLYNTAYKYLDEGQYEKLEFEDILCINTIEADTTEFINNIGVRSRLKGYKYLKEYICIELLRDTKYDVKDKSSTIKTIAENNNTEKSNIERNIRYAIEDLKKNRDYRELNEIIGCEIFSKYEVPTNLEFVLCAAERIREFKNRHESYRDDSI